MAIESNTERDIAQYVQKTKTTETVIWYDMMWLHYF